MEVRLPFREARDDAAHCARRIYAIPPARDAWEALLAGPLAGRTVTRVICTHFHPDHIGMAGWLVERFGVRLWMTRGEWLFARMLLSDVRDAPPADVEGVWQGGFAAEGDGHADDLPPRRSGRKHRLRPPL